jgi:hypothetical protein
MGCTARAFEEMPGNPHKVKRLARKDDNQLNESTTREVFTFQA